MTAGELGQLYTWDVERGAIAERLSGHTGNIDGLDIATDGRTLLTASADTRAILWDLAGDRRLDRRFAVEPRFDVLETPRGIAVSPDGRTLALTHSDGTVELVDTRTLAAAGERPRHGRLCRLGRLQPGRAAARRDREERAGHAVGRPDSGARRGAPRDAGSLPGTGLLARRQAARRRRDRWRASGPHQLRVWDVRRRQLTDFRARTAANLIAFSPDGELIAAAATDRGTEILDARTGDLVERLEVGNLAGEGDFSRSVAFSPDGNLLFVGQYNGTGRLFSTETWKQVGRPLRAHTARITFPEFSPDGRTLITAAADGTVILWDVATQKQIGAPIEVEPNSFVSAALSPDGKRLYAISAGEMGARRQVAGRRGQLRHVAGRLEAPRVRCRRARHQRGRVGAGAARAALPVRLLRRLTLALRRITAG